MAYTVSKVKTEKKTKGSDETFIQVLLGILAIFAIRSLFEHDNSKIISKKGTKILSDVNKMNEIDRQLKELEKNSKNEIII